MYKTTIGNLNYRDIFSFSKNGQHYVVINKFFDDFTYAPLDNVGKQTRIDLNKGSKQVCWKH